MKSASEIYVARTGERARMLDDVLNDLGYALLDDGCWSDEQWAHPDGTILGIPEIKMVLGHKGYNFNLPSNWPPPAALDELPEHVQCRERVKHRERFEWKPQDWNNNPSTNPGGWSRHSE